MTLPLRQRRRLETAREIQRATLALAVAHGLEHVTTEAIAEAAGISTRTFFNYYTNKEAASVGIPPAFREEDKAALRQGTASLAIDLKQFMARHIASLAEDEAVLRMVRQVIRSNANARGLLDRLIMEQCHELTDCLSARERDPNIAMALADGALRCAARAIYHWETEDSISLADALDTAWADHIAAARILTRSP